MGSRRQGPENCPAFALIPPARSGWTTAEILFVPRSSLEGPASVRSRLSCGTVVVNMSEFPAKELAA